MRVSEPVYAIVRNGGGQTKVAVGDVIQIDAKGEVGSTVQLPAVLLVQDGAITSDAESLAGISVTAEVLGPVSGPKLRILHYKNKTRYRVRQGHRQHYTQVKITGIDGVATSAAE